MKILLKNEIVEFSRKAKAPCLSLFLPTHRLGEGVQRGPIRLKNLLREARKEMTSFNMRANEEEEYFRRAWLLVDDESFWQHQLEGLGIFISSDQFRFYHLPFRVEEQLHIRENFYLRPLLPLFSKGDQFYVLALNQKHIDVYEGNRYKMRRLKIEDLPESLAETLRFEDGEKQLQLYTAGAASANRQDALFHGQGTEKDALKNDHLVRFFRDIDNGLHAFLRNKKSPLLLAGVEYYFSIYRSVNSYPHLIEKGVTGSPESGKENGIHPKAWELVKPKLREEQKKVAERYQEISRVGGTGFGRSANRFDVIVPAAYQGRVNALFIARDLEQWGTFDPEEQTAQLGAKEEKAHRDLVEFAALHTLQHDGDVYIVSREEMPDESPMAAIMRY
ncbi:MAG: hypothetical protein WD490_10410 [Opitutales bacterium]